MNPRLLMTKPDTLLIAVLILILPWLYISFWGSGGQGEVARVQIGQQTPTIIPLQVARRYSFEGPLGTSVIEVQDGHIRFFKSPCSGKQCIHSGWLGLDGDFAACLPNLISITISGQNPRFDSINF